MGRAPATGTSDEELKRQPRRLHFLPPRTSAEEEASIANEISQISPTTNDDQTTSSTAASNAVNVAAISAAYDKDERDHKNGQPQLHLKKKDTTTKTAAFQQQQQNDMTRMMMKRRRRSSKETIITEEERLSWSTTGSTSTSSSATAAERDAISWLNRAAQYAAGGESSPKAGAEFYPGDELKEDHDYDYVDDIQPLPSVDSGRPGRLARRGSSLESRPGAFAETGLGAQRRRSSIKWSGTSASASRMNSSSTSSLPSSNNSSLTSLPPFLTDENSGEFSGPPSYEFGPPSYEFGDPLRSNPPSYEFSVSDVPPPSHMEVSRAICGGNDSTERTESDVGEDDGVPQARPVLPFDEEMEVATPFDEVCIGNNENDDVYATRYWNQAKEKRQQMLYLFAFLGWGVICLSIGITIGIVLAGGSAKGSSTTTSASTDPTTHVTRTPHPTAAPTSPSPLDLLRLDLPNYTLVALDDFSTPQWQAYDWLSRHPELHEMPPWRTKQLFALGCFYFSMEGPEWRDYIQSRWLQYDSNECYWFNSEYGDFVYDNDGTERWEVDVARAKAGIQPCNPKGEIQSICIAQLEIENDDPTIFPYVPREISMLPALSLLGPCENDIHGTFYEILPTELFRMDQLTKLNLINNALTGPLPSELGLMTSLTYLNLQENHFTGSLPSELFLLTNLSELHLQENQLTGEIPSQSGLMTKLSFLELFGNRFTGSIPKELLIEMPSMSQLFLHNNNLTGTLIATLSSEGVGEAASTSNQKLTGLSLGGNNNITGVISEELCLLGQFNWDNWTGLSFNCTDHLCGCEWCPCSTTTTTNTNDEDNHHSTASVHDKPMGSEMDGSFVP